MATRLTALMTFPVHISLDLASKCSMGASPPLRTSTTRKVHQGALCRMLTPYNRRTVDAITTVRAATMMMMGVRC